MFQLLSWGNKSEADFNLIQTCSKTSENAQENIRRQFTDKMQTSAPFNQFQVFSTANTLQKILGGLLNNYQLAFIISKPTMETIEY